MKLTITSPISSQSYEIAWFECETIAGSMIIQRGHAPTIIILAQNKPCIFKLKTGKQKTVLIESGIAHITRTTIHLLLQSHT